MKTFLLLAFYCTATLAVPSGLFRFAENEKAEACIDKECKAEDGCRCASSFSPFSPAQQTPQFISLTFDDAVTDDSFKNYWQPLLFNRKNPDQNPIGATFFVPHEYTDYERVNDLYNYGFEIGVHSITKNPLQSYWRTASVDVLEQEFGGQKQILSKFANIPAEDIVGVRTPQLQLAGNNSIRAYQSAGLIYDSSWPTLTNEHLYPYTLDYLSGQKCLLGNECPNEAFKGFWILPINNLHGVGKRECDTLVACNITGSADEIADWLIKEVEEAREFRREPLTLLINSFWFSFIENSFEGFAQFLDRIATYEDVFLVSQKQLLEWMKNPLPVSEFKTDFPERNAFCAARTCLLRNSKNEDRMMKSCISCPPTYPWLGNPEGK